MIKRVVFRGVKLGHKPTYLSFFLFSYVFFGSDLMIESRWGFECFVSCRQEDSQGGE